MPITTKIAAALLAIFLALFAGAWLILDRAVRPGFERMEAADNARDLARVQATLRNQAQDLNARTLDYSRWDDTYRYMLDRNPRFLTTNFDAEWFGNYGVDLLVFADSSGRILWTQGPAGVEAEAAAAVTRQARRAPSADPTVSGVAWTRGGPIMFSAAQATGNSNNRAPLGYVIMGRRLYQQGLRQQAQLDLSLISAQASGDLAARFRALGDNDALSWVEPHELRSLISLRAADGSVIGAISARRERETMDMGMQAVAIALGLFALISATALGALWLLLQRLVISRVRSLERHLDAQSNAHELEPLKLAHGRDEIGRLTQTYNALVMRLRESATREAHANVAREAAASANRMKSDFLANISYELRTPLNAVIGYAELIEEELSENGFTQATADLDRITGSARHLLSLINEIHDLSKIEVGKLAITPESFNAAEMLQSAIDAAAAQARATNTTLVLELQHDLGAVYSDQQRLRQCLVNMLVSVCKVSADGTVTLRARRVGGGDDGMLRFEVQSTAHLSTSQLARAFDPFSVSGPASQIGGLGLGIAQRLTTLLGGRIEGLSGGGRLLLVLTAPAVLDRPANDSEPAISLAAS